MIENQDIDYQPPTPARAGLYVVIAIVFLLLLIMGLIAGWGTFLKAAPVLVQMLVYTVIFGFPLVVIGLCAKTLFTEFHQMKRAHLETQRAEVELEKVRIEADKAAEELEALRDARQRENEAHQLMLAEAQLIANEAGNYPAIYNRRTGQVITLQPGQFIQPVPNHYAPRFDYRDTSTRIAEEQQAQLAAASLSLPKIEQFYSAIPFNSLQVGLGLDVETQQLIIAPIERSTHFKFVGGSNMGKSCVAAAVLDIATTMNDADHLRLGLLDLEYNTSRLFENVPHIAEIGPRRQRLIGRDPDEVAQKLKLLQWELNRRADLGEAHCRQQEPLLLVYVEEMLALKYEVVDEKLKKEMLAAINILGVRGRKYLIYFLACMQTDYSDKSTREAMAQYRTRGGFAIDPDTARASGFFNTQLVKQNFQTGRPGQYVLEKPSYSGIVLAPDYDVKSKLLLLNAPTSRAATRPTTGEGISHYQDNKNGPVVVAEDLPTTAASQANVTPLSAQERRILKKYREGMSINAIISSEFVDGNGKPLAGGRLFTEKAREIQALISRYLPIEHEA